MKAPSDRAHVSVHEDEIAHDDILLGRGGKTNHHPGNASYLKMIEQRQLEYMQLGSRAAKTAYAMQLVRELRKKGIRFLKRDPNAVKVWKDVGDTKMREKVSQNLREHQPVLKKQLAEEMEQQRILEETFETSQTNLEEFDLADGAELLSWDVEQDCQLSKPCKTLPPPLTGVTAYPSQYYAEQHQDDCHQRYLPPLDMPRRFQNHPLDAELPRGVERLPPPDFDSALGDLDPIPFDEAVGAATTFDEDLWTPCAVAALRKRSFVEPQREGGQALIHGVDYRCKRPKHTVGAHEHVAATLGPHSPSYFPSFEPPPANDNQQLFESSACSKPPSTEATFEESLMEPISLTEEGQESMFDFHLLEPFSENEQQDDEAAHAEQGL